MDGPGERRSCTTCGAPTPANTHFCGLCGTAVGEKPAPSASPSRKRHWIGANHIGGLKLSSADPNTTWWNLVGAGVFVLVLLVVVFAVVIPYWQWASTCGPHLVNGTYYVVPCQ
ncbi:MAG: hypothetical protein KGJ98_09665 [Chloroflexota bacterium]|nr:hypothetical protein [Chloroflexota bacterium]